MTILEVIIDLIMVIFGIMITKYIFINNLYENN